jgi:hypothetical protein
MLGVPAHLVLIIAILIAHMVPPDCSHLVLIIAILIAHMVPPDCWQELYLVKIVAGSLSIYYKDI